MTAKKLSRKEKIALNRQTAALTPVKKHEVRTINAWGLSLAITAFLIYALTLGFQYTLDDYSVIMENSSTKKGAGAIAEFFSTSYRYGYIFTSDELYRPLSKFIHGLQWSLAPSNPFIGHLFNVLLYSLTAFVLFNFLKAISKGRLWFSFFTCLLFIVHPLHTEVVANIKSIDEILGFLFGILSLLYAFRYATVFKTSDLIKSSVCFLLALLSKESSITFFMLIPLMIYFFAESTGKKRWLPVAGALLVTLVFIGLRSRALGDNIVTLSPSFIDNMLVAASGPVERICTAIYITGLYLYKVFIPYPLSFDNSFPQLSYMHPGDWPFILSFVILSGMLIFALIQFRKKTMLVFGILFFFISFSISSNLFITIGTHYGERLFYTALLGCIIAIMALADQLLARNASWDPAKIKFAGLPAIIPLLIAGIFSIVTINRSRVWYDNSTLFASGLISAPNSTRVQFYMGNHLIKDDYSKDKSPAEQEKILDEGIAYLKKAISLTPTYADAWNKLGIVYMKKKNYEESARMYVKALEYNPADPVYYNNLGTVYFNTQQYDLAFKQFQQAVKLNPRYVDALVNLGSYYGTFGKPDDAITYFNEALKYDPNNAQAYYFLGITYQGKGNNILAKEYFDKAFLLNPSLKK